MKSRGEKKLNKKKEKEMTPLQEAHQAKEEMSLNIIEGWNYDKKMRSYIHFPFLKPFPFASNFYGINLTIARECMQLVRDVYEHHLYWVVSSAFDILREGKTYPYQNIIGHDELKYGEVIDSYGLENVRFPDKKKVHDSYYFHFYFKTYMTDKTYIRYPLEVVLRCKLDEQGEGYYQIWSVGYKKEMGDSR